MSHTYLEEEKVVKGGRNPVNTSDKRPPAPKGSGVAVEESQVGTVKDCTFVNDDTARKAEPKPPPYLANERRLYDYRDLRSEGVQRMIPLGSESILVLLSGPPRWMIIEWKYGDAGGDKLISWEKYTDTQLVGIDTMVKAIVGEDYCRDNGVQM